MSLLSIDYSRLVSSNPPIIPYDVTFLISNEEKGQQGEVQGHKFVFALNSPIFRTKFCGAGDFADKNDKEVKIIGTLEAFQLIKNYFYNQPTAIDELSVAKIFEVVKVAHFYDIGKLEEALEQRLEKIVIAKEDVMEVAKKAEEFAMFEMASKALLENCSKTLQGALNDAKAVFEFSSQVAGTCDEAICFRLFTMIKDLPPLQPLQPLPCSNCRQSPCISGAEITSSTQVRPGTRITVNTIYWGKDFGFGRTEVVSIDASWDRVKIKAGDGTLKFDTGPAYPVKTASGSQFCFAC